MVCSNVGAALLALGLPRGFNTSLERSFKLFMSFDRDGKGFVVILCLDRIPDPLWLDV
jgi:hypothetical protein